MALSSHSTFRLVEMAKCTPEVCSPATVLASPGTSYFCRVVDRAVQNNHRTARPSIMEPSRRRIRRSGTNATALAERCMGARFKGAGQTAREIRRSRKSLDGRSPGAPHAPLATPREDRTRSLRLHALERIVVVRLHRVLLVVIVIALQCPQRKLLNLLLWPRTRRRGAAAAVLMDVRALDRGCSNLSGAEHDGASLGLAASCRVWSCDLVVKGGSVRQREGCG
jgi:hypothetical protein